MKNKTEQAIDYLMIGEPYRLVCEFLFEEENRKCHGCGDKLGPMDYQYNVCMDCTRARHKSVLAQGKCMCGKKRVPGEVVSQSGRSWIPCERCLGNIKSLK